MSLRPSRKPPVSRVERSLGVVERKMTAHTKKGNHRYTAIRELLRRGAIDVHTFKTVLHHDVDYHDFGRTLEYYAPIHAAFQTFGKTFRRKHFLHLGSSFGLYTQYLQSKGVKAVALDANHVVLGAAKKIGNKRVVTADANVALPFKSNSFNYILSDHFLFSGFSQLFNEPEILREVHRVLAPNGIMVLSKVSMLETSVREILSRAGFTILECAPDEHHYFMVVQKKN